MFNGKHTIYVIILFFLIIVGLLFLGRGITGFATADVRQASIIPSQEAFAIGIIMIIVFAIVLFDFNRTFGRKKKS